MKKILKKENIEVIFITSVMVGLVGLIIYNSIVHSMNSSPW